MGRSPEHIHSLLCSVVRGNATVSQLNELVRLAHGMAVSRLQHDFIRRKEQLLKEGVSLSSIAMDSIAEIFARNEQNEFIVLNGYFGDIARMSPAEAVVALRALVFESLHDGVVRLYQEIDPVYAKILRTLRRVLPTLTALTLIERFGDTVVTSRGAEQLEFPRIEREALELSLAPHVISAPDLKSALQELPRILCERPDTSGSCTVSDLAAAIKHIYAQHAGNAEVRNGDLLTFETDLNRLLQESFVEFEQWLAEKYVRTEKLGAEVARSYAAACRDYLSASFVHGDGQASQYWDYLQPHLDGVSYETYRSEHRNVFEYALRRCMAMAKDRLKELL